MAGLLAGLIALFAIIFFMPFFYYLPKAVLSSIIFIAVLFLLSELPEDLHFIFKIGAWRDLGLLLVTFLATMIISLEFGTLIAVTLSLLITIRETSYPRISIMVNIIYDQQNKQNRRKLSFSIQFGVLFWFVCLFVCSNSVCVCVHNNLNAKMHP